MDSATTTTRLQAGRFSAARLRSVPAPTWARVAFAALAITVAVGFLVFPTYPNYDSYYSLLWGREVLDLDSPVFEGFRVPTEHPLGIAWGALLSLLGDGGDRVWVGLTLASFLALVWGIYRLGRIAFTPLVGAIAAVLLVSRFDFPFLAARGYIDVPYMALVIWAGVLEAEQRRRGTLVLVLLAFAGTLRPEAWVLAGLYWLYLARAASWPDRVKWAALAAIGPVTWAVVDFAVTGDPMFSLTYTSSSAEELGRQRTLGEIPAALPTFFIKIVKAPVFIAGLAGLALATALTPRRMGMPAVLLASGIGTFLMIGLAGLSVIDRYLVVAGLALLVFAGVALGGWTMLAPGRLKTAWMLGAAGLAVYGLIFTLFHVNVDRLENELRFRGDSHAELEQVLHAPAVEAAARCGPVTLPNHKLVPDTRWIMDLPFQRVWARAEIGKEGNPRRPQTSGVAVVVTSRVALFKHAFTDQSDEPAINLPPPGFRRAAVSDFYAAYVGPRC